MIANNIQDLFQITREEWLDKARHVAQDIIMERGSCTIEDVLADCPRPDYLHRNTTGQVFRPDIFKVQGFTKSRRPISNGRIICIWTIHDQYMPMSKVFYRNRQREEFGDVE